MSETNAFPYEARLDVLYKPLELIDENALAEACEFKWWNQALCKVNGSVVRMAVVEGEYHWHKHDNNDEFFYVIDGGYWLTCRTARWSLRRGRPLWFPKARCTAPAPRSAR